MTMTTNRATEQVELRRLVTLYPGNAAEILAELLDPFHRRATAMRDLPPDASLCRICWNPILASHTARIIRVVNEGSQTPHHVSVHVGCEAGPTCPEHRVLMDGGGINWTCPIDGCDETVPDSGDQL